MIKLETVVSVPQQYGYAPMTGTVIKLFINVWGVEMASVQCANGVQVVPVSCLTEK